MSEKAIRYGRIVIDRFMIWKLAAVRCFLKALLAAGAAFLASGLTTSKLAEMGPVEKWQFVIGLLVVIGSNVDAFLDKTISNVSERLGINAAGNTEILTK